ncbi:unnamed protein product [Caenorhabditis brenneri]
MTFPLLRLPLLASTRIIKYIDVGCLIPLIQLSKNSKNLVKLSKVHIKLTVFQSSIQFKKLARQDGELECVDLSEKTPKNLPFEPPCHLKFETKMQYQIGAYKKVLDDFVEFFKVCSVSFDLETACSYTSLCFMEYAKNLGLRLRTVRVVIGGANGKVYQSLLKLCSNASQLLVLYDTHENFKFDGFNENIMDRLRITDKKRQTEKYFYSRGINWFTVDHMCALVNCSKVSLKDSHHMKFNEPMELELKWSMGTGASN